MAISHKPLQEALAARAATRTKTPFGNRQTIAVEGIYDELTRLNTLLATLLVAKKK